MPLDTVPDKHYLLNRKGVLVAILFVLLGIVAANRLTLNYREQINEYDTRFLDGARRTYQTAVGVYADFASFVFRDKVATPATTRMIAAMDNGASENDARAELRDHFQSIIQHLESVGFNQVQLYTPEGTPLLSDVGTVSPATLVTTAQSPASRAISEEESVSGFIVDDGLRGYRFVYPLIRNNSVVAIFEMAVSTSTLLHVIARESGYGVELFAYDVVDPTTEASSSGIGPLYQPASSVFVEESKNRDALRSAVTAQARRSLTAGNDLVIPAAVDGDYFAVSFLSVQDHSGEHAGYLVTYERTRAYRNLNINTAERIAIVTLGFVLAAVIIILTAKARYQAEAANRTKSQFLANVSHDLRTPLNGIMGMISTLENPDMAPDKRQEYLRLLRSSTNALFHLLDSLLEISRIEADRVEIDPYPVDLSQFASDLCQEMRATELSRGLELRLHINEDVPRYVSVDESRLRRVLFNCIHNGLKFTNEGGVSVYVTVHKSEARTAWIQFQVVDTGIGIPQDQLDTVFEKFSQADNSYSRLYGGTGLGLSIVKAITELMGGTVEVHSVLGVGTTIRVVMPMEISDQQSVHIQQQVEHGMSPGFRRVKRGFRVLLVEDDRIGRIVGSELLKQQDWDVDLAEDGQVALTKASPGGYDLILMDWRMPNMDGAEATRRLLEIWEERGIHPAPIIGLTVSDSPSDRETLRAVGMSGFLSKPLQMAALSELVADFFADTPIDLDVAESSFESADEMVGEILPIFLAQAEDRLKAIRSSMETDDYEQAARQTHPLKTAARYIGAHRLGELAARLDAWVSKRENLDAEEFQQTIAKLQKELARIAEWADERRGRKLPKTS